MLLRRPSTAPIVRLRIAGRDVDARADDTVAVASIAAGVFPTRITQFGTPRAPWCLMGVCFECLMTIDGEPNRQACMIPVRDGMVVDVQQGLAEWAR